ncbi:MAG: helix-turn-helix domain-containing protein [Lentisphaerae bacterium]|nr:helix-turn-helix domain-containing protein [Lentisphaerota bacterium]
MSKILKDSTFFQKGQLPVYLYYTDHSGDLEFHSHEFSEIAIMFNGNAIYETDYSEEKISTGDVLVIPPGGLHCYREEKDVRLMNIIFHFEQLNIPVRNICHHPGYVTLFGIDPDFCHQQKFYPKFKLPPQILNTVETILITAYELQKTAAPGALLAVYGAFLQIIPLLLTHYSPNFQSRPLPLPEKFQETVNYMLKNYLNELNIAQLAPKASMSQSTFTRTFSKSLGKTPLQYLLHLRLEAAREFLRNGCSVSEAALKSGFKDSSYFTRLFHKHLNSQPRNWKKH